MNALFTTLAGRSVLFVTALTAAVTLTGIGCKREAHPAGEPRAAGLPKAPVRVQPAEVKSLTHMEEVVGTVRARQRAVVEAKSTGRILEMPVVLGAQVKEGELLARIDAAEHKARLDQAQAALVQAEQSWNRISGLFKAQASTQSEYDTAESALRSARAAVKEAQVMVSYTAVEAPFSGVITRKLAEAGDFATPGKGLVELEALGLMRLEADVPESLISGIQQGGELTVSFGSGSRVQGKVSEVAPSADPGSRTFLVKVDLPQVQGLRSGQFGRLLLPTGESRAVRVPVDSLVVRGQLEMVFVAENQHAHMRLVRSGKRLGDEVEILAGVQEKDPVIVSGAVNLLDGQPVEVR